MLLSRIVMPERLIEYCYSSLLAAKTPRHEDALKFFRTTETRRHGVTQRQCAIKTRRLKRSQSPNPANPNNPLNPSSDNFNSRKDTKSTKMHKGRI